MSNPGELIAAIDIGKTHARVSVINPRSGAEVWSARRAHSSRETPLGWQLDVAGIEHWLIEALSMAPGKSALATIVPIAHGAAAVWVGHEGEILAAPDYEDSRFERVNAEYEALRDPFTATGSPSLPLGLNLGRQLFYLQAYEPELFSRTAQWLLYPQFWAWRLSGVMASEVTSLGCHSDLWQPHSMRFSALAQHQDWVRRFPSTRFAGEVLGGAAGPLARAAGLDPTCRIVCGVHDSNASYLRHLIGRREAPFAVVSSGTWTIVMAHGASLPALRAERDMLANVNVFGTPVPTARFMGGREYETIARGAARPSWMALETLIRKRAMALPSFAAAGPFAGRVGRFARADDLNETERATLAVLYLALMSDLSLDSLGAAGELTIDGPLASNPLFGEVLAALREGDPVRVDEGQCATQAVCYLAGLAGSAQRPRRAVERREIEGLREYKARWLDAL